jgi:hypothetical protein
MFSSQIGKLLCFVEGLLSPSKLRQLYQDKNYKKLTKHFSLTPSLFYVQVQLLQVVI